MGLCKMRLRSRGSLITGSCTNSSHGVGSFDARQAPVDEVYEWTHRNRRNQNQLNLGEFLLTEMPETYSKLASFLNRLSSRFKLLGYQERHESHQETGKGSATAENVVG